MSWTGQDWSASNWRASDWWGESTDVDECNDVLGPGFLMFFCGDIEEADAELSPEEDTGGGSSDPQLRRKYSKDELLRLRRAFVRARMGLQPIPELEVALLFPEPAALPTRISARKKADAGRQIAALEAHLDETLDIEYERSILLRREDEILLTLILNDF